MSEESLATRFAAVAHPPDDSDWEEVVRRAELETPPHRRRRHGRLLVALAAIGLLVALLVTPAFGLQSRILSLFEDSEPTPFQNAAPAPAPIVKNFQMLEVGVPAGQEQGVRFRQARKVYEHVLTPVLAATIYAAPSEGGFCILTGAVRKGAAISSSGGCLERASSPAIVAGVSGSGNRHDPRILSGTLLTPREATTIELRYQDGRRERLPLEWISEPIEAAFFVFGVAQETLVEGKRPASLVAIDAEGHEVARDEMVGGLFAASSGEPCIRADGRTPCEAVLSKRNKVLEITTEKGIKAALWSAPSRDGGLCSWNTYGERGGFGGGCQPAGYAVPATSITVGRSQGRAKGREVVLLSGQVGSAIASLELRYEGGEHRRLTPVEHFVLAEIPARHYGPGHRLSLMIGRDSTGAVVARSPVPTDTPGSYPCDKPKQIAKLIDGEAVFACP